MGQGTEAGKSWQGGGGAGGSSIASIGFNVYGDILRGQGEEASQKYQAERAQRRAEAARVQAKQVSAQYDENLATTLGNIDAVRSAAGVDPSSPTGFAVKANEERISNRAKNNAVASLRQQANEDENEALYRRRVASDAIRMSYINAGASVTKGLAGLGK